MSYSVQNIRNVCLLGHSGSGKTALAESLLYMTGAIDRMGRGADGNTVCDYDPEETKRQISISTAVAPLEYKGCRINVLDTPGAFDFSGEVMEALRAADAAVIVCSAKDGISVGLEKAWKYCEERNMPRFVYISKTDEDNSDYNATFEALRERFGKKIAPIVVPIWDEDKKVTGIIDVLNKRAFEMQDLKRVEIEVPEDKASVVTEFNDALKESVAETSEAFMDKFFSGEDFTYAEMIQGLRQGVRELSLFPVLCGSAVTCMGSLMLMDNIVDLLPNPMEGNYHKATRPDGETEEFVVSPGGVPTASAPDGKKSMHVVFVDNGRKAVLNDPILSQALRCVRCGACANVCPVYRLVGGHRMGYIYIGAIGLILTYLFHGKDRAKALVQNCVNCQACKSVCAAGIDLPGLIEEIRMRYIEQDGNSLPMNLLASTLKNRKAFHTLLKFAKYAQKPLTGGEQFIRHLPSMFAKDNEFRALPAIADKAFRDRWEKLDRPVSANPSLRVAIFAGCVQDFVYPEQLEAAVKLMQGHNIRVDFPMDQSCCGLPVVMMGQRETARDVALQNMDAFEKGDYDVILTLCASCASQLKEGYVELFAGQPGRQARAKALADKVMDFSTFAKEKLGLSAESFNHSDEKVTYHASCHLCRGLGVKEAPRELIAAAADYVPAAEEEVCCGFGGTYSAKFPEVSAALLRKKLDGIADTGAARVVMDCPGCVLQIRGGAEKDGKGLKVTHISELLAENLKK